MSLGGLGAGLDGTENLALIGIRSPDRPARSESLSWPTKTIDIATVNFGTSRSHSYWNNGCTAGGVRSFFLGLSHPSTITAMRF